MHYSLFVFRFYYKVGNRCIFKKNCGLRAAGLPVFGPRVWAGLGPETSGTGRAGPGRAGPGLCQTLTVWVGPGPKF